MQVIHGAERKGGDFHPWKPEGLLNNASTTLAFFLALLYPLGLSEPVNALERFQMVPRETRSKPFKVNLTPTMHCKLSALAERLGMPPAALASIAIAEYVASKTGALEAQKEVMERMVLSMAPQLEPLIEALTKNLEKEN